MMKKKYHAAAALMMAAMLVTACGSRTGSTDGARDIPAEESAEKKNGAAVTDEAGTGTATSADASALFSNRDLSGAYDASGCDNITLSDDGCMADSPNVTTGRNGDTDTVTITGGGDYIISGALSNGMIIVDVDKTEKVQLVLHGVDIRSAASAAVYVRQADKVFVTLADGTENFLSNGGSFAAIDDNNIDAVIFSKDDLTLNGTGALEISSPAGHGIVSKNELTIADGNYEITAASHGMTGKDSVAIADGSFRITAGEDAIKSDNSDDVEMGSVYIFGGNYLLSAVSDGINALNEIRISGGKLVIEQSNEGLEARIIDISGGETDITSSDDGLNATDKRASAADSITNAAADGRGKGFGGGMDEAYIRISGGIVRVNAEGDGLDSNGHLMVSGGEVYVAGSLNSGDSALDYDMDAVISGGIVVAVGQSGMAQNFGSASTQGTILIRTEQQNAAGSEITLLDGNGSRLVSWTAVKGYNSVVISCPEIRDGETYTVRIGGTDTEVTMNGLVYGQEGAAGGRGGGKRGFPNGTRPDGMTQPPDGTRPNGMAQPPDGTRPERMQKPSGEDT